MERWSFIRGVGLQWRGGASEKGCSFSRGDGLQERGGACVGVVLQ